MKWLMLGCVVALGASQAAQSPPRVAPEKAMVAKVEFRNQPLSTVTGELGCLSGVSVCVEADVWFGSPDGAHVKGATGGCTRSRRARSRSA